MRKTLHPSISLSSLLEWERWGLGVGGEGGGTGEGGKDDAVEDDGDVEDGGRVWRGWRGGGVAGATCAARRASGGLRSGAGSGCGCSGGGW